jgi:mono/diheme cytochrome c family protein
VTRSFGAAAAGIGSALIVCGTALVGAWPARVMAAPESPQAAGASAQASEPGARSTRDGVYSAAQADRGGKTFTARCLGCHPPDQFVGPFLSGWDGQTVNGLFEMMRTSMPDDDPGSLTRQDYADILAFVFKKNGVPAGPAELTSVSADLKRIVVDVQPK